jgi:hypothetical protein
VLVPEELVEKRFEKAGEWKEKHCKLKKMDFKSSSSVLCSS